MATPPLVIPVFIPHFGCPHQCVFCNQSLITGLKGHLPDTAQITDIINRYLPFKGQREQVELAFFGGNFLGLDRAELIRLLDIAAPSLEKGIIHGIRFSTRPDTVTPETLDLVAPYPVSLVELGVQSMDDNVLQMAGRGHTRRDTLDAVTHLRAAGLLVGVQVMAGLPGDREETMIRTARSLADLEPATARIYPLVVLENTPLARAYRAGKYTPMSLEQAVEITAKIYGIFSRAGVNVIRMGLQETDVSADESAFLAGPRHPAFGHLVLSAILYKRVLEAVRPLVRHPGCEAILLRIHPRSESRLRGYKNENLKRLNSRFSGIEFKIEKDPAIAPDQVVAEPPLLTSLP